MFAQVVLAASYPDGYQCPGPGTIQSSLEAMQSLPRHQRHPYQVSSIGPRRILHAHCGGTNHHALTQTPCNQQAIALFSNTHSLTAQLAQPPTVPHTHVPSWHQHWHYKASTDPEQNKHPLYTYAQHYPTLRSQSN